MKKIYIFTLAKGGNWINLPQKVKIWNNFLLRDQMIVFIDPWYTWNDVRMTCNAFKCHPFASLAFNKCPHFLSDKKFDVRAHRKRWYQTCKLYLTVFTQCNYVFTYIFTIISKVYLYIYCMILYYNIVLGDTS